MAVAATTDTIRAGLILFSAMLPSRRLPAEAELLDLTSPHLGYLSTFEAVRYTCYGLLLENFGNGRRTVQSIELRQIREYCGYLEQGTGVNAGGEKSQYSVLQCLKHMSMGQPKHNPNPRDEVTLRS